MTFDNKRVDFYTPGEYWIVKSSTVKIQARYKPTHITSGLSVTKEIVFGGSFMKGHFLRVSATTATYDGKPICTGFPSSFSNDIVQSSITVRGGHFKMEEKAKHSRSCTSTCPTTCRFKSTGGMSQVKAVT